MSTILARLCKQASYPGRGAAIGTVAGGLAGYGLADDTPEARIEGAALGAAAGGLGGYGLGRAYLHRPLGPAITDKARLLGAGGEGAGGEGAAELEELRRAYPTRASLLERTRGGAPAAPRSDTEKALTRHMHENLAGGAGIGAVSAGYASDAEDRNTSMLRGAMGGAILGGMVTMPHVVATKHLMGPETEYAARIARGNKGRKTRDLGELVEKQRAVATRFGTMGRVVGAPLIAMNGVNVAEEVSGERKNASFLPRVVLNQGLAGTALGAAGGALAGGEDHRMQGAAMGAVTGGIAGLGTGAMAHRAYNAAHAPLAKREQLSRLVQQGIMDQTPSPLGRAMVATQGDDARRTIREGVTQAAQDSSSSKMTRRVGGTLGTLGAMGVAETLRAQPKPAAILDAIFKVH